MDDFEFEVKEISKTTFKGGKSKEPVLVATLETADGVKITVKEEGESSFEVGEAWSLQKTDTMK